MKHSSRNTAPASFYCAVGDHHVIPVRYETSQTPGPICLDCSMKVLDALGDAFNMPEVSALQRSRLTRERANRGEGWRVTPKPDAVGHVYYVRVGDLIKIGYSSDVRRRLKAYPPDSVLLAVEPGPSSVEGERHGEFRAFLERGREWFRPSRQLLAHIEALVAAHGDPKRFAHEYRRPVLPGRELPRGQKLSI